MGTRNSSADLNSSQARHLLTSAQYADKLFSEVEEVLSASKSHSPFRKYKNALSPGQIKVVEDYLAGIRAQLVRALAAQNIPLPEPQFDSVHTIRTTLAFVKLAFDDCAPERMRGYGEVTESKAHELNGLVEEMVNAVEKLNSYLAQGLGQDFPERLERLEKSGGDITLLKTLERIINIHGLVEFRSTLSMIIDRLEAKSFEIALFGRVSCGKSSLLNAIVQSEILPVGVNPITAVPTRLLFGPTPRLTVRYADRNPEPFPISELAEFVTEQRNPGNHKHVTHVLVELPAPRLSDGVIFVDTPGLGSLATCGAAETLAYLPRCDLGVVLVDAASTLTEDDLGTIRALYEAGIPASVLLSKSDLLAANERAQSLAYVSQQITARLGLRLSVNPVSVQATHSNLLEDWLQREILPLCQRHRQAAQESLRRKMGVLRQGVENALRVRVQGSTRGGDETDLAGIDQRLRNAVGRFADARKMSLEIAHEIEDFAGVALAAAAAHLVDQWNGHNSANGASLVRPTLTEMANSAASRVYGVLEDLARELSQTLEATANDLGFPDSDGQQNLTGLLRDLPGVDLGNWEVHAAPGFLIKLSKHMAAKHVEDGLRDQIGDVVAKAFYNFGKLLDAWARRALSELQLYFDARADAYRAHLERLSGGRRTSAAEEASIKRDLDQLARSETVSVGTTHSL